MKIVAGELEIQVLGAFEDFLYEQDQKRPAFRMRFAMVLTNDEIAALNGQTLSLYDDSGRHISSFEGYNAVHECTLTLVKGAIINDPENDTSNVQT